MLNSKAYILNGGIVDTDMPKRIWSKEDLYQYQLYLVLESSS